jgi:GAF domain-containing protein
MRGSSAVAPEQDIAFPLDNPSQFEDLLQGTLERVITYGLSYSHSNPERIAWVIRAPLPIVNPEPAPREMGPSRRSDRSRSYVYPSKRLLSH